MYIPQHFRITEPEKIESHIQQNPFGLMISNEDGKIHSTHLPFYIEGSKETLKLVSHMARANGQWKHLEKNEVLVVFTGPDAYISPSNYEKKQNVPTWNYTSVHLYGRIKLLEGPGDAVAVLEKTIDVFEPAYMQQWKELDESYKANMYKGLVAFEFTPELIQGKFKLSQNKTEKEIGNIIRSLGSSEDPDERKLSETMRAFHDYSQKT